MSPLLRRIITALREVDALSTATQEIGVFAFTMVGSSVYLPPTNAADAGDVDIILLSHKSQPAEIALPALLVAMQRSQVLRDTTIYFVHATACILKVMWKCENVDLSFCGGCEPLRPWEHDGERPGSIACRDLRLYGMCTHRCTRSVPVRHWS